MTPPDQPSVRERAEAFIAADLSWDSSGVMEQMQELLRDLLAAGGQGCRANGHAIETDAEDPQAEAIAAQFRRYLAAHPSPLHAQVAFLPVQIPAVVGFVRELLASGVMEQVVMEAICSHWFAQGGDAQFGPLVFDGREPANADECVSAMLRLVRAGGIRPQEAPGWQPIETCPKDHAVLLWEADAQCATVGYRCDRYTKQFHALVHDEDAPWNDEDPGPIFDATHWMPLPPAPPASGQ